ncbi:secondary thiamine-phosphate synthase enzyme YjbQ [Biformimicrobium ophioploci]|uniref:Secondary thiamine-phosphate synthase enzyme YjbQ n=1 Tax=Biformimicrobium ophioploci TaxID=3036711 RepID=A0ABQ6LZR9_9GAMM|nr:secondary thiamine-phosphate synthase enzyme YjbQ [Microbulbifer sp. NKW57]GMG87559.1 secondary thiamine-phosphate synthase enzyme YjbQ [Microbulbifer sp. NKW57]
MWIQKQLTLKCHPRGFHIITDEIERQLPELRQIRTGLLHLFLQHTSASLGINENADPTVRADLEEHFNRSAPDGACWYQHDYEGDDDMPAHIKCSTLGCQITIPISSGLLALGTWQGICLGEHRDQGGARRVIATIHGE